MRNTLLTGQELASHPGQGGLVNGFRGLLFELLILIT